MVSNIVFAVVPDMKLSPNVGSDRSWVWNVAADVSEGEPTAETLAIRFANSDSKSPGYIKIQKRAYLLTIIDANLFKESFEQAQKDNAKLFAQQ